MRWTVGVVLAVTFAGALGLWSSFPPSRVNPNVSGRKP
jgi:hypothetical protein